MDLENLRKLTGLMSLAFGIYSVIVAFLVVAFEAVAFFIIFALIFLAFGILYIIAGISLLRKGRLGFFAFIGVFGSTYWWGLGMPIYIWPMMVMPMVILILFAALFIKSNMMREY
jgi:hypothetical protein